MEARTPRVSLFSRVIRVNVVNVCTLRHRTGAQSSRSCSSKQREVTESAPVFLLKRTRTLSQRSAAKCAVSVFYSSSLFPALPRFVALPYALQSQHTFRTRHFTRLVSLNRFPNRQREGFEGTLGSVDGGGGGGRLSFSSLFLDGCERERERERQRERDSLVMVILTPQHVDVQSDAGALSKRLKHVRNHLG